MIIKTSMNSIAIFAVITFLLNCGFANGRLSSFGNEGHFLPLPALGSAKGNGSRIEIVKSNSGSESKNSESNVPPKKVWKCICQEDSSDSSEEFDGCCEDGWTQNEDKCYRAFEEPLPYDNKVCDGFKNASAVRTFWTASEYQFLKSKWDMERFWPVRSSSYSTARYGEFCRKYVGVKCPERGIYEQKRSEEREKIREAQKDKGKRCCQQGWTLIEGLCYRAFNDRIMFYEQSIKCDELGAKPFSMSSRAVEKFAFANLKNSSYFCMMISTICEENQKTEDEDAEA